MRSLTLLAPLLAGTLVLGFAIGCGESQPPAAQASGTDGASTEPTSAAPTGGDDQPLREVRLAVEGMTCEGCVSAVESKLAGMPGVRAVEVSLAEEAATVRCVESVSNEALVAAVAGLNFEAAPMAAPAADAPADHDHDHDHDHDPRSGRSRTTGYNAAP